MKTRGSQSALASPPLEMLTDAYSTMIREVGEDLRRPGLVKTPERAAKAMQFLTSGYETSLEDIVNGALFDVETEGMVIVRDIEFYSLCEHHMLPFFGKMHVAYLPQNKVIGLSKIPRIVDMFARRLQVQEQLTEQVAKAVQEIIAPRGVGVIAEARHFCMMMRGVEKQHSGTITSTMLGDFKSKKTTRDEFLSLVSQRTNPF
ncbi:MAG: GTP cyclohydrolase I FolE [Acidobacteria bacterium]|nr:GTP cyclohydrolase I FolE [Acidobacteriota bacterium]